jgi:ribosomal protein S18 acetylase RimI-like enzyme
MSFVQMSRACPEHTTQVIQLVTEISAWLARRGIDQWASPPGPDVRQLFAREIAAGQVYVARLPGSDELVGLLRFEWHDADLWPADPDGGAYVHSLGVRPVCHGRQIGVAMLRWAAKHVSAHGRRWLRLDCVADNWALRAYYQQLGFHFRGVASHAGYSGALFELDLESVSLRTRRQY